MNVYVESNFVLELVLSQEQKSSCERILELAEKRRVRLGIPAYSLAEPLEKINRLRGERERLSRELDASFVQIRRNAALSTRMPETQAFLRACTQAEEASYESFRQRLLESACLLPLNSAVFLRATQARDLLALSQHDALVFSSIEYDLRDSETKPLRESCFLNRNNRDFQNNIDLKSILEKRACRLIPNFDDGLQYVQARLGND
jgi:hypothetical protein